MQVMRSIHQWLDSETPVEPNKVNTMKIDWLRCAPFILTHLMCFGVIWVGVSPAAVYVCLLGYAVRVFSLTAFYHRKFAHRAFKTGRIVQFIFAFLGCAAAQRGPLWWSAHHRYHHAHSDKDTDKHSPVVNSFLHSHTGWFLLNKNFSTDKDRVQDLMKYPELVFINRFDLLPPFIYASALYLWGGWQFLIWGYFISTVLVYHVTFCINSIAHKFGTRDYDTDDESRNNWWLALLTFGEGWHNNHHHWPSSARQGFKWHQVDITFMILLIMSKLGLVWDLRLPPATASV